MPVRLSHLFGQGSPLDALERLDDDVDIGVGEDVIGSGRGVVDVRRFEETTRRTVRVLPEPVAITSNASRCLRSKASPTALMARIWYGRPAISVFNGAADNGNRV